MRWVCWSGCCALLTLLLWRSKSPFRKWRLPNSHGD